jgi:two-component system phosphate regulon sensor histidine kinase PhoR
MSEVESLKSEIAQLKGELAQTKAVNQKYLQNVAHQLTAPLGSIKWSIEALKDEHVPISRKSVLLSSIYSQATILVHLIKNFALMSNLEADLELGQFREKPEPINMFHLSINLANDFQPQALDSEIKIVVIGDSFKKVFGTRQLEIEKNLVAQAASNIIENAVKYADRETTVMISACLREEYVGIQIESVGIPIIKEEIEKIFMRGFRGYSAKQKVAAGTGIGLYLASRVMNLHGGNIKVEADGKHSRFTMLFPVNRITKGH